MIDPLSFLLGMYMHDIMIRSVKKSTAAAIMNYIFYGIIVLDILIRIGAFQSIQIMWQGMK